MSSVFLVGIFFLVLALGYCWKTGINILPDISNEIVDEKAQYPIKLPESMDMTKENDQFSC